MPSLRGDTGIVPTWRDSSKRENTAGGELNHETIAPPRLPRNTSGTSMPTALAHAELPMNL
jgi:hypothetical protein